MPLRPCDIRSASAVAVLCCLALFAGTAGADSAGVYALQISDAGFSPATVHIPAGQKVQLKVTNSRRLPSEFESFALNREKVVPPGGSITVWVGPLKPGHYSFFDDFNPGKTGEVVVDPKDKGNSNAQ